MRLVLFLCICGVNGTACSGRDYYHHPRAVDFNPRLQRREFHIHHSPPLREDAAAAENGDNEMNMMNRE
jgi:hypothetical protein